MPNDGFSNPFIQASFIDDDRLFVTFFHNMTQNHYHFVYNITDNKSESDPVKFFIEDTVEENFPVDCFYNDGLNEAYVFYRQG